MQREALQAREDRFVLEMLEKIDPRRFTKDVTPLATHFHKMEALKAGTVDKEDLQKTLQSGGGLMGMATNFISECVCLSLFIYISRTLALPLFHTCFPSPLPNPSFY